MKKHQVTYQAGESRTRPGEEVDYMIVEIDGVELYAEAEPIDGDETATYDDLKSAILEQAAANDVPAGQLHFYYDRQED